MVIIAREFAVTGLRMLATSRARSSPRAVGQAQDHAQVAMVLALIWVDRPARWVDILVYVTVAVTVLSGADYFYRLREVLLASARAPSSHSRIET